MAERDKAMDELWRALSKVILALADAGADDGRLREAVEHMDRAHRHMIAAGIQQGPLQ